MATRNVTMVVDRKHAKEHSEGFAANPCVYADNSYVNMYLHHDGYPEWQGVQLANFLKAEAKAGPSRTEKIESDATKAAINYSTQTEFLERKLGVKINLS